MHVIAELNDGDVTQVKFAMQPRYDGHYLLTFQTQ
jgi:hypothetical protein